MHNENFEFLILKIVLAKIWCMKIFQHSDSVLHMKLRHEKPFVHAVMNCYCLLTDLQRWVKNITVCSGGWCYKIRRKQGTSWRAHTSAAVVLNLVIFLIPYFSADHFSYGFNQETVNNCLFERAHCQIFHFIHYICIEKFGTRRKLR
jgi:hypothetical protein